jgi:hypothetical protein
MPYAAAVSLCSQGRKGSRCWTTTRGCHVTAPPPHLRAEQTVASPTPTPANANANSSQRQRQRTPTPMPTPTPANANSSQRQLQRMPTPTPANANERQRRRTAGKTNKRGVTNEQRGQRHGANEHNDPHSRQKRETMGASFFFFLLFYIFIPLTTCHCCEHLLAGCLLISFI